MNKELGKIENVRFGFGGYQDAMFGLSLTFSGAGWGICDFVSGGWQSSIEGGGNCKWTEHDRNITRAAMVERIDKILTDAKVDSVDELKGKPVEVTFDGMTLKEWRILKEVL